MSKTEDIVSAALALPPADRAMLADKLLESLSEQEQSEIDVAWAEEARQRLEAFDRGDMEATPAEESLARRKMVRRKSIT